MRTGTGRSAGKVYTVQLVIIVTPEAKRLKNINTARNNQNAFF